MKGEREGEKRQFVLAFCTPCAGDLAQNPGMCPDWELNRQPFGLQASTQSTEAHQPEHKNCSFTSLLMNVRLDSYQTLRVTVVPTVGTLLCWDLRSIKMNKTWSYLLGTKDQTGERVWMLIIKFTASTGPQGGHGSEVKKAGIARPLDSSSTKCES